MDREAWRLQSMGSRKVRHDRATNMYLVLNKYVLAGKDAEQLELFIHFWWATSYPAKNE